MAEVGANPDEARKYVREICLAGLPNAIRAGLHQPELDKS